jgi:hypothetical protein
MKMSKQERLIRSQTLIKAAHQLLTDARDFLSVDSPTFKNEVILAQRGLATLNERAMKLIEYYTDAK